MLLSEEEIAAGLASLAGWSREATFLIRLTAFSDFAAALAFVNQVGDAAEAADHHPDIRLYDWNKVELKLTTHSESGLTSKDLELASKIEAILSASSGDDI
ncbi:MAG: 4a-hydroxytetrahydrobiopterin dehydratase [Acidobacteria bacterium]|nr:4a-hydroxytetrahydrobiopterin dehydratase [Acidobacteriota bacterium]